MPLDPTANALADLVRQSQTVQQATAPSGGRAGQLISLRVGGRPLQARCLVSFGPGPVVAVLTPQGWACLPVAATRQVGVRPVEFRQRRGGLVPLAGGVAVLYSVVVGAVREFWVKTAAADVKVHEIPLTLPFTPTTSIGGVGATANFSGSYSGTATLNVTSGLTAALPTGGQFLYQLDYVLTWTGPTSGPSSVVQWSGGVLPGSEIGLGWNPTFGLTSSASGTSLLEGLNDGQSVLNVGCVFARDVIVGFDSSGTAGTPSANYSVDVTIVQYQGPTAFNVLYESWISPAPGGVFVIVKHAEELFFGCGTEGEIEDFEFTDLLLSNGLGQGILYENGDEVEARANNWRVESEDFLRVADQPATASICIDNVLDSITAAIAGGKLYTIDLDQDIDSQTLRNRLQTSPDTVAATLVTRTATDTGGSCTLGDVQTSTVQVPSPGRGTIEGITYLPP